MFAISVPMIYYHMALRPLRSSRFRSLEIYNEITFLFCLYFCLLFTWFVDEIELRYKLGWVYVTIVLVNLFVNFGTMTFKFGRRIY